VIAACGEPKLQTTFTIGELAREFDVTLRTLRFYEDKGLIRPQRQGVNRVYSRRDRARLKLIVLGKKVGFPLSDIKSMLDLYDLKDGQTTQLRVALSRFSEQVEYLKRQKRNIQQAIDELTHTMAIISGMLREREARESGHSEAVLEAAE
jgi:DNA-binding transcriptional MerR regulator